VFVVLHISPVLSPRPRVLNGELLETHFDFDPPSRTALEQAIELKFAVVDGSPAQSERDDRPSVRITAIAIAPRYGVELLRRALALGADDAVLIETDEIAIDAQTIARLVADHIGQQQLPCDLVLCGAPVLAAALAGNLGLSHFTDVKEFVVDDAQTTIVTQKPEVSLTTDEPVVLNLAANRAQMDFNADDFFDALTKPLSVIDARELATGPRFDVRYRLPEAPPAEEKIAATPDAAAALVRTLAGIESTTTGAGSPFSGTVELAPSSTLPRRDAAVLVATAEKLEGIETAAVCAEALMLPFHVVVFGQFNEPSVRAVASRVPAASIHFVSSPHLADRTSGALLAALRAVWKDTLPPMLAAGDWANELLTQFARAFPRVQTRYNIVEANRHDGTVQLMSPAFGGKVQQVVTIEHTAEHPLVMTIGKNEGGAMRDEGKKRVLLVPIEFEYDREADEMANALAAASAAAGAPSIADADFIVDVGYAVRNKENFDLVIAPLKKRLEEIGVKNVMLGGTRKVVEELKLLGSDQQIGQTGTAVNPKVIISIGVSGAPQHIDYIGERATIIAFNKDPEAPLMTLNKRRARPRVVPIVGDLFETVPEFTAALRGKT